MTGNIYQGATSYMTATSGELNQYTNLPYGTIESPANPNLKWEQSRTTNIGIDFGLLDNRLRGSIDYYNKVLLSHPRPNNGFHLYVRQHGFYAQSWYRIADYL